MLVRKNFIYRHFKGALYLVKSVGTHTETGDKLVVYEPLGSSHPDEPWVRPLKNFQEDVERGDYNYKGPRFRLVGELTRQGDIVWI